MYPKPSVRPLQTGYSAWEPLPYGIHYHNTSKKQILCLHLRTWWRHISSWRPSLTEHEATSEYGMVSSLNCKYVLQSGEHRWVYVSVFSDYGVLVNQLPILTVERNRKCHCIPFRGLYKSHKFKFYFKSIFMLKLAKIISLNRKSK